ncbi:hypothetical protein [Burkholderia phage FLC6]|nr:hypothetical protein [Burkholderia phage FLC6]BDD79467.1 hypothetical protein [Burkholderia phage FLC8]
MGFYQIDKPRKSQVSLSSWQDTKENAKQGVKNAAHDVKEAVVGSAKNVGHAAVRAVRTINDAYGTGSSSNKDLKARMTGHSSFRERTRGHDD